MKEEDSIWTEDEGMLREMDNMINSKGKSCSNCQWGMPGEEWVTCGHHSSNFKADNMCCYWTNPEDPKLLAYQKRQKDRMLKKLKFSCNCKTPIILASDESSYCEECKKPVNK